MGAKLNRHKSKQDYQTPPEFMKALAEQRHITPTWDLAASADNAQAKFYYTEQDDSLARDWDECGGWLWLNPPYGNIAPWVKKASETKESSIAILVPASTGSNWWRDYVHDRAHVLMLNGRIQFVGAEDPYPKDCALLIYTPAIKGGYEVWSWKTSQANSLTVSKPSSDSASESISTVS